MIVTLSMCGNELMVFEFLLKATHFPANYTLWEDVEFMKNDAPGFSLHFSDREESLSIPFSLGKFIIANKSLLLDETIIGKNTVKEISIEVGTETHFRNRMIYIASSKLIKLVGELNFIINITKLESA